MIKILMFKDIVVLFDFYNYKIYRPMSCSLSEICSNEEYVKLEKELTDKFTHDKRQRYCSIQLNYSRY